MEKKFRIIIKKKEYLFSEITVSEYGVLLRDTEQFLYEYFAKYSLKIDDIPRDKIYDIINTITGQSEEKNLADMLDDTQMPNTQEIYKDFHIVIGRFMYAMHLPYSDVMNMPLSIFERMMKDFEYICGEKDKKIQGKSFSGKPEKNKLRQLFSYQ